MFRRFLLSLTLYLNIIDQHSFRDSHLQLGGLLGSRSGVDTRASSWRRRVSGGTRFTHTRPREEHGSLTPGLPVAAQVEHGSLTPDTGRNTVHSLPGFPPRRAGRNTVHSLPVISSLRGWNTVHSHPPQGGTRFTHSPASRRVSGGARFTHTRPREKHGSLTPGLPVAAQVEHGSLTPDTGGSTVHSPPGFIVVRVEHGSLTPDTRRSTVHSLLGLRHRLGGERRERYKHY